MESVEYYVKHLPFWESLLPDEKLLVTQRAVLRHFAENQLIGGAGESCMGVVYVISGGIRVSLISDEGREVTLFRLAQGDCCVTTAACVIKQITFDTCVVASEDSVFLVVPVRVCEQLAEANKDMKIYLLETEAQRYSQVVTVMEQMLFKHLDQRVAGYLVGLYKKTGTYDVAITQEELSREINSAREAVARVLHRFSEKGLVSVKRGHVILHDVSALEELE